MSARWGPFSRLTLKATGVLACEHGREASCRLEVVQLYNGRILVRARVDGKGTQLADWAKRCQSFSIAGTVEDGRALNATNVHWTNWRWLAPAYVQSELEGFVGRPGCVEIGDPGHRPRLTQAVSCDLTNALLDRQVGPLKLGGPGTTVTLRPSPDHRWVRRRMKALGTSGVLSRICLEVAGPKPLEELDDTAHVLCDLLTLVHRSPVAIVGEHWDDPESSASLSRYREPPFLHVPPLRPMVPTPQLGRFLELTYDAYLDKWQVWDLPNAIDHYVQAHVLRSAWAQAVGFFTSLETLKQAFLAQGDNPSLERYLPARELKKRKIVSRITDCLERELRGSVVLTKADRESLHSKVGDLNRRAYRQILEKMFERLGVVVTESDLRQLKSLRDQIIHRGSPDFRKGPWRDGSEAYNVAARFAGVVEATMMAILGYHGQFDSYDQLLLGNSHG
jgi:hypothetical protein